ncbi:MAG: ABC transporter ATP-binding protein [Acidimicrobiales bacterium]
MSHLSVRYGPVVAIDDVSLSVDEGAVVGLIGPNGAGKTTFIDAVTGFTPIASGCVEFAGHDIARLPVHQRASLRLGRTFQSLELFEDLTVAENVLVAADRARWWHPLADMVAPSRRRVGDGVSRALATVGLAGHADRLPTALSHGQRRNLGLARAVVAQPKLLLLDEPGAGLDPSETAELGTILRRLPPDGTSVLLVDHDMGLVLSVCDVVWVLDFGHLIATGTPAEIRHNPQVVSAYLGHSA